MTRIMREGEQMEQDGGPAFPRRHEDPNYGIIHEPGMTLRQWFAGQALAGPLMNAVAAHLVEARTLGEAQLCLVEARDLALALADAMLAARSAPTDSKASSNA